MPSSKIKLERNKNIQNISMVKLFLTILLSLFLFQVQSKEPFENKEEIKQELVRKVDAQVKNHYISVNIVEAALANNIDICFMMAQSHLETNYGKAGVGKTRNSLFGIYTRYADYKASIDDYCNLLRKNYLVKGKTEKHLLRNYVNKNGKRYSRNRKYEMKLCKYYKNIAGNKEIQKLQNEYYRVTTPVV